MLPTGLLNTAQANLIYLGLDGRNALSADLNFNAHAAVNLKLEILSSLPLTPPGRGHIGILDSDSMIYYSPDGSGYAVVGGWNDTGTALSPVNSRDIQTATGKAVTGATGETLFLLSGKTDTGASSVGFQTTTPAYSTPGAKHSKWLNDTLELMSLNKDGDLYVAGSVSSTYGATIPMTTGEAFDQGNPSYIGANGKAYKAKADDIATSKVFGATSSSIPISTIGNFTYSGLVQDLLFVTGLSLTNGDAVYLSADEAGKCSNNVPVFTGQFIVPLGFVLDVTGYATDAKVKVLFNPQAPVEV
jgi:hypothetical protein